MNRALVGLGVPAHAPDAYRRMIGDGAAMLAKRALPPGADDLHEDAPELACSPRESTFRQYRDTRFSENKTPLKTYVAFVLRPRGCPKGSCRLDVHDPAVLTEHPHTSGQASVGR